MRIAKNRISALEKVIRDKNRPNGGCAVLNFLHDPLPQEEIDRLTLEGIKIVNVTYTDA